MPQLIRSDVFLAGDGVEEIEVDDPELLELLDQLDDVAVGEADAGLGLLRELELPLQLQQLVVHGSFFPQGSQALFSDGQFLFKMPRNKKIKKKNRTRRRGFRSAAVPSASAIASVSKASIA